MATIAENLVSLNEAKQLIKLAIEAKGRDLSNVPFTKYAEQIIALGNGEGGGSIGGDKAIEIVNKTVTEITSQDIIGMGMTQVLNYGLYQCTQLQSFISTKEQNIVLWTSAFDGCSALKEVYASSMVGGASSVFNNCKALEKVVFFRTTNFNAYGIFGKCSALKLIDLRTFTQVPTLHSNAFVNANPTDCKIIVPDNLYDNWIVATNWANLTDRGFTFVKASEYTEPEV